MGNKIVVKRPAHVPQELMPVWKEASRRVASKGRLLNNDGTVDYLNINEEYRKILSGQSKVAGEEGRKAYAEKKKRVAKPLNSSGVGALLPLVEQLKQKAEALNHETRDDRLEVFIARLESLHKMCQNLMQSK